MSKLLKQVLILGCSNVGKSKFLEKLSYQIFTPVKKEGRNLQYLFAERSFRETQKRTRDALSKYIKSHSILYLDEPFYYLLPFEEKLFSEVLKKNYIIATHRTAYFLLSSPSIIFINKKGVPININILELEQLIKKPSLNFFETDLINYSIFLSQFNDIQINPIIIEKIKNYPDFRDTRTTYFIRDFLIWFIFHQGDLHKKVDRYEKILSQFFEDNSKNISKDYQKVINKCLGFLRF